MKQIIQSLGNLNVPNALTTFRLSLIPVFVVAYLIPSNLTRVVAAIIFFIAGLTDYLDGYFARYLEQSSKLGEFLDPVADKLLVVTALVLLVADPHLPYLAVPVVIIIGREIAISALREWMAELGQRKRMQVSLSGKIKTFFQMFAIFLLILSDPATHKNALVMGYICLYIASGLTLYSMLLYLQVAYDSVCFDSNEQGE